MFPSRGRAAARPYSSGSRPRPRSTIDLDYVEVFPPQRFGLVLAPGSGVIADTDHLTFELPASTRRSPKPELDGVRHHRVVAQALAHPRKPRDQDPPHDDVSHADRCRGR